MTEFRIDKTTHSNGNTPIEVKHATPEFMKKTIAAQELIFQDRLNRVDSSRNRKEVDAVGNTIITYYDADGNELYSRTEASPRSGYIYGYLDDDGNRVSFSDRDRDGNMDEMGFTSAEQSGVYTAFQAYDVNDDGIFDEGMPCTGKNAGQHVNIKL